MRIGIDGSCLSNRRGFGRFARELLQSMARAPRGHELTVFLDRPSMDAVTVPPGVRTVAVDVKQAPSRAASASGRRSISDMFAMGLAVARERLDLFYFPASYSFYPVWHTGRVVVTMHDTLALTHPDLVFPTKAGRMAWMTKEYMAVNLADRIVTISETSKRDLMAWFKLPDERVTTITEGPDAAFQPQPSVESAEVLRGFGIDPSQRFLLYVGGLSPHKNLLRLIEAIPRVPRTDFTLVLVGDFSDVFHTNIPQIKAAIKRLRLEQRVKLTGFVPDGSLAHLYSRAYALVHPSLMEGFGLPAVEAMACGTPVISSTAGSLPEVIGDAGLFFDPQDPAAIASAIDVLLADPRKRHELSKRAIARAELFTWERGASLLFDAFEDVVDQGSRRRVPA